MTDAILALDGLTKSFGAVRAAKDVRLDLLPGEIHALIGPNGAGKSTLIQLTAGGLQPDAGVVRFAGRDVTQLSMVGRARAGLGRTFQISALFGAVRSGDAVFQLSNDGPGAQRTRDGGVGAGRAGGSRQDSNGRSLPRPAAAA